MTNKNSSKTRNLSNTDIYNLICEIESSINSIAWGCGALMHTIYDAGLEHVDGAVWVADKVRAEAISVQEKYQKLFQIAVSLRR